MFKSSRITLTAFTMALLSGAAVNALSAQATAAHPTDVKSMVDATYDDMDSAALWQVDTSNYRDSLLAIAQAHGNYTNAILNDVNHTLVIEGTGSPDADVAAKISAAPSTITASWQSVPYTSVQLNNAAYAAASGPNVISTAANDAGDGITITINSSSGNLVHDSSSLRALVADDIPFTIVSGTPPESLVEPASDDYSTSIRFNDYSPFTAGDGLVGPDGFGVCSTGIPTRSNQTHGARLIFQSECSSEDTGVEFDEFTSGQKVGMVEAVDQDLQAGTISTSGTDGHLWAGGVHPPGFKYVVGAITTNPSLGTTVCISNAFSGSNCYGKVSQNSVFIANPSSHIVTGPYLAVSNELRRPVGGDFDGGSAVHIPLKNHPEQTKILGMEHSGVGSLYRADHCNGWTNPGGRGRGCFWAVYVLRWTSIRDSLDVSIRTSTPPPS